MSDFAALRTKMIDSQLKTEGVNDPTVLSAFAAVPREEFVPAPLKPVAYVDTDLVIKAADRTAAAPTEVYRGLSWNQTADVADAKARLKSLGFANAFGRLL